MIHAASPIIGGEEIAAVTRVMESGMLAQGREADAFEIEFAAACDTAAAAAVSNGTMAIVLALQAIGIEPGDEVIVPSFTFAATANAVVLAGAKPMFADCERSSLCLDPAAVAKRIGPRTRAIIPVHLYGHMADMHELSLLAEQHDLAVIEDAAQAHGAMRDGQPVGKLGHLATYSFYPTKNMTTGEGGMVTSGDPVLIERVKLLRNHGMPVRYQHEMVGTNARMTDIGAAIGRVQLGKLAEWNNRRREIARIYDAHLADVVTVPAVAPNTHHVYHQYTVRSDRRDAIIASCEASGIGYGIYYPIPCHRQPAFRNFVTKDDKLPETDSAAGEVLSVPIRPDLSDEEVEQVISAIVNGATT